MLLNREPSPVESYNDINGEIVNFFRVLRNQTSKFVKAVTLTPYSREEYLLAIGPQKGRISDLERARRFFVRAHMTIMAVQKPTPGIWKNDRYLTARGMSAKISAWIRPEMLRLIAARLMSVQIDHDDWRKVVKRYDTPDTLFYCDPPYPSFEITNPDVYGREMTIDDHVELAETLASAEGLVAISSYVGPQVDELYSTFLRIDNKKTTVASATFAKSDKKVIRQEALYVNYEFDDSE